MLECLSDVVILRPTAKQPWHVRNQVKDHSQGKVKIIFL